MMKKVRVLVNGIEIKESPPSSLMRYGDGILDDNDTNTNHNT